MRCDDERLRAEVWGSRQHTDLNTLCRIILGMQGMEWVSHEEEFLA